MKNEAIAARKVQADSFEHLQVGTAHATIGLLGPWRCLTVASGFGENRVERCMSIIAEQFRPRLLINFGAAGALRHGLAIGAVTIPREVVPYSWPDLKPVGEAVHLPVEAFEALDNRIEITRAGTCCHDIRDESICAHLVSTLKLDTTDCETYQLARLCVGSGIPFVAMRCVTDHAGASAGVEYGRHARNVLDRGARFLEPLVKKAFEISYLSGSGEAAAEA